MAYVTVSTWTYDDTLNEKALKESAEANLGQLKAMGALSGHLIRTGPKEGAIVVIYPDEGTWNRVRESVLRMRAQTLPEVGGANTGALAGPAVVSV